MIIFSSADMEASRGAIHKGMRETPITEQKSRYSKSATRLAAGRTRAQAIGMLKKYPIHAVAVAALLGFTLGAFSDVRRFKRS
jgi:hypothetical protein